MFATAYLLYVLPAFILQSLFLETVVLSSDALVPTLVAFVLLRLYLATSITNKLVKAFVYYGMGVGFLALMILSMIFLVKTLTGINGTTAGVAGLLILGLVTAYCVINANSLSVKKLTVEQLDDWCRERLAAYKVPRSYVFRDELPKSSMMKLLRRVLRDEEVKKSS